MGNDKRSTSSIIIIVIVLALLIGILIWYFTRPKDTSSSNNNLDSLVIANYPITFDQNTTTYTINVDEDVDSLEVKAVPEDKSAKVVITGNTNIATGSNEIKVTVTSADGNSKIYTIHVNKKNNDIIDDIDNDNKDNTDNKDNVDNKDNNLDTDKKDDNNNTLDKDKTDDKDTKNNNNLDSKTKSIIYE